MGHDTVDHLTAAPDGSLLSGTGDDDVLVAGLGPRHAMLRFKNIGALARYDAASEARKLSMTEMEALAAAVIAVDPGKLAAFDRVKGAAERNTRLFPADLAAPPGRGVWFKLTDWQANAEGLVDPGSRRRGWITEDFRLAPFFEHVKANEGEY